MSSEMNDDDSRRVDDLLMQMGVPTESGTQIDKLLAYIAVLLKGKTAPSPPIVNEEIRPSVEGVYGKLHQTQIQSRQDTEMLDWFNLYIKMRLTGVNVSVDGSKIRIVSAIDVWRGDTLREAIAAAMKAEKGVES